MPMSGSALLMRARLVVNFFRRWVRMDLGTLGASLAVLGGLTSGLEAVYAILNGLRIYLKHLFTSSVSIAGRDGLNREVISWLGAHVLERRPARSLLAQSQDDANIPFLYLAARDDRSSKQRLTIKYLPTFSMHYFWFRGTLFMVQRQLKKEEKSLRTLFFDRSTEAPTGRENLLITCVARSVEPIKKFLTECKEFAKFNTRDHVVIRSSTVCENWDTAVLRLPRPLETVHFDQQVKDDLVADITNYLKPETREFYTERGIPYRRGYLLYGPPGTGKSSLSFALAGHFQLEVMVVNLPGLSGDKELATLFVSLPPQCIVLIEDIDAVGLDNRNLKKKKAKGNDGKTETTMTVKVAGGQGQQQSSDSEDDSEKRQKTTKCTLSGLLNVLDGVTAQQGRIVLMTTNHEDRLDAALTRPGRIDKKVYLGHIGTEAARKMFIRMYAPPGHKIKTAEAASAELLALADRFCAAGAFGNREFTPAQVQEYLLRHRESPRDAVEGLQKWIDEEIKLREDKKKKKEEEEEKTTVKVAAAAEKEKEAGKKEGDGKVSDEGAENKDKNGTSKESGKTDGAAAAAKEDDKNDSSKNSSDVEEVVILSTEASNSSQSDSSSSKDPPVEPEKES